MTLSSSELLRERLISNLAPVHLQITDDSHAHAGHNEAARHGGTHFSVAIVSDKFDDLNLVARHRLVYYAVGDLMKTKIHALSMQTLSPEEWRSEQAQNEDQA